MATVALGRNAYNGRLSMALPDEPTTVLLPENVQRALVAYGEALTRLNALTALVRDGDVKVREAKRADVAARADAIASDQGDPGDVHAARVQEDVALARRAQPVRAELVDRALMTVAELVAASAPSIVEGLARDCIEQTRAIAAALDQVEAATVRRDRARALIDWTVALGEGRQPGRIKAGGSDVAAMFDALRTRFGGTDGVEHQHLPEGNGHGPRSARSERARAARLEAEAGPVKAGASQAG